MSKIIDITDKLSFEGNPKLIVKDVEIEVNTDAPTVLKFMQIMADDENTSNVNTILKAYELLFSEESRKKITNLKVGFNDLMVIVKSAMELINSGSKEGEE